MVTTGDTAFERDIYKFLPKMLRDIDQDEGMRLLERYLQGMTDVWDSIADRIEDLRGLANPLNIPDAVLQHIMPLLGFGGDLSYVWNALSPTDLRRLAFAAVSLWRFSSTEQAVRIAARFLSGKPFLVRNLHDFLPVADDLTFGISYDTKALWVVGSDPSPYNMDSVDLHIVDEGDLDHTLLRNLIGITRAAGEKVVIVYAQFLDRFRDAELTQWSQNGPVTAAGDGIVKLGPGNAFIVAESVNAPFDNFLLTTTMTRRDSGASSDESMTIFRLTDLATAPSGYLFGFESSYGLGTGPASWFLARLDAGVPTSLAGGTHLFADEHEYHFAIHCFEAGAGTYIRITVDGAVLAEVTDAYSGRNLEGDIGFSNEGGDQEYTEVGVVEILPQPADLELVASPMKLTPTAVTVNGGATVPFTGFGGAEDYYWSIPVNNSGASIAKLDTDEAEYTAGFPGSTVVDTVRATDVFGNYAEAQVTVEP